MHDGHDCLHECQHNHNCDNEHPHTHPHGNCHCSDSNPSDESKALLEYMLKHNRSHADELNTLAHSLGGDTAVLVYKAIMSYEAGNENLAQALNYLNKVE